MSTSALFGKSYLFANPSDVTESFLNETINSVTLQQYKYLFQL